MAKIYPITRRRRWVWWGIAALAGIALLLMAIWFIGTSGWFLAWLIRPELERRLGGTVAIRGANYDTDGTFRFDELVLRAPDIEGVPGEIVRINGGRVVLNTDAMWRGEVEVKEAEVDEALIRISENSAKLGDINVGHLQPTWEAIDEPPASLPEIVEIKEATIQVGRHLNEVFEVVGERRFTGQMLRSEQDQGQYDFELAEIGEPTGDKGVRLTGDWNLAKNEFRSVLRGFRLDDQAREMCPPVARAWWDEVNPQGRVGLLEFTSSPARGLGVRAEVEDLSLTLPINPEGVWARFEGGKLYPTTSRPRMQVKSGTIEVDQSKLLFQNMVGTLGSSQEQSGMGSVPYRFNFEMTDFTEPDWGNEANWIETILDEAPFELTFLTEGFQLESEDDGSNLPVDLPYAVADVLQRFQLTGGTLEMEISLARQRRTQPDTSAEITVNGKTWVRDATGAYEFFPYLLEQVNAFIEFNTDAAKIVFLTGTGSDGATVRVTGDITPLNDEASVNLSLATSAAPIDERLRAAMPSEHREILDSLFSQEAYELLESQGLLPDERWQESLQIAREEVVSRIRALRGMEDAEEELVSLRVRRARLDTLLDLGAFNLGGLVVLDLQISRAKGLDQPTNVTGTVEGAKVGLLYEEFPYPVWLIDSVLRWTENAIYLESKLPQQDENDGLYVVTAGGGQGFMRGRFGLDVIDDEVVLSPQLFVQVLSDRLTPFLEAAIPPIGRVQPDDVNLLSNSGGKALMAALNLDAELEYIGEVTGSNPEQEGPAYDVTVRLKDGSARPQEALASLVGAAGLFWPAEFSLTNLSGRIHVKPGLVEVVDLRGMHDSGGDSQKGAVQAEIRVARRLVPSDGSAVDARLAFEDLALGAYLINLAPAADLEMARSLWQQYTPQGRFDAVVNLASQARGPSKLRVDVVPQDIQVTIDNQDVQFQSTSGTLALTDQAVSINGLEFTVTTDDRKDGQVALNGSYGLSVDQRDALTLDGSWKGGQFSSPVIPELLRLVGDDLQAERYLAYDPDGGFSATFNYRSVQPDSSADYTLLIEPINLGLTIDDVRLVATLDRGSNLVLTPQRLGMTHLAGSLMEGRFEAVGYCEFGEDFLLQMAFDYDGPLSRSLTRTLLPSEARDALEAVAFAEHGTSELESCTLRVQQSGDGPRQARFSGRLRTSNVSFAAGIAFAQVEGQSDVVLTANQNGTFWSADGLISSMRIQGNLVENAEYNLEMKPVEGGRGSRVELSSIIGQAYRGTVFGRAAYDTEAGTYDAEVEAMNVSLDAWFDDHASTSDQGDVEDVASVGKGLFFGRLSVAGQGDDVGTRRGRGVIQIRKGNMADNPITLGLVQLAQLGLPVASRLDFLNAPFFLVGNHLVFEEILLEATAGDNAWLLLKGQGTLELGTWELDTTLHSRSGMSMLFSPIADLGDQFVAIGVKGDVREPDTSLVGFPGLSEGSLPDESWYRRVEAAADQP